MIKKWTRRFVLEKRNPLSAMGRLAFRAMLGAQHCSSHSRGVLRWLWNSREITNYTYDLTEQNQVYLAHTISLVTGVPREQIAQYLAEPLNDAELAEHIKLATKASVQSVISDDVPRFGRRLGWYAFVRALKPRIVIETGIDKGLGSVLLCSALLRNRADGNPGMYLGTDINPAAGFLLAGKWAEAGKILYGDSIESLRGLSSEIDLFINDSDHSSVYELAEYRTVKDKLSSNAVLLGDNSHCSPSLVTFAEETGRSFLFFAEQPANHWYPGSGIGICFPSALRRNN